MLTQINKDFFLTFVTPIRHLIYSSRQRIFKEHRVNCGFVSLVRKRLNTCQIFLWCFQIFRIRIDRSFKSNCKDLSVDHFFSNVPDPELENLISCWMHNFHGGISPLSIFNSIKITILNNQLVQKSTSTHSIPPPKHRSRWFKWLILLSSRFEIVYKNAAEVIYHILIMQFIPSLALV